MQARAILEAAADADRRPAATRGRRSWSRWWPRCSELDLVKAQIAEVAAEVQAETGVDVPYTIGTMIELPRAALTADQIAAVGRLLLLRHQRPDPDDLGILPRRRRGVVLPDLPRPRDLRRSHRSSRSTPRASARWCAAPARPAARPDPTCTSASAASTAATPPRSTSSSPSGWTTSPARRSGSPWRGWRRDGPA